MTTILPALAERCAQPELQTLPKYARIVAAIQGAIADGVARPGDRIPTEADFAKALPFALGTVQKALNELVDMGVLSRHRKTGTFVRDNIAQLDDFSRFNFERADGSAVDNVKTRVREISRVAGTGRWSDILGESADGYVRLVRSDRIDDAFDCHVETHLRADAFGSLLNTSPADLAGKNIRTVLQRDFQIAIARTDVSIASARDAAHVRHALGLSKRDMLFELETTGTDQRGVVQFLQTNYFPDTGYRVRIF